MGSEGGVSPILGVKTRPTDLDCLGKNYTCLINAETEETNATAIVQKMENLPNPTPSKELQLYIIPRTYTLKCRNGKCQQQQIFVINLYNSR